MTRLCYLKARSTHHQGEMPPQHHQAHYVLPILPKGLLETEPLQGRDEDTVASTDFSSMLSEEEKEELKAELVQVCSALCLLPFLLWTLSVMITRI